MNYKILIYILISYFIGAVPVSFIFCKLIKGVDIRKIGSRNVGATNAARVLGKKYFFIITFLDALKGFIPVFIFKKLFFLDFNKFFVLVIISVILGHTYSIYLKFKGGKGVATSAGVFLAVDYRVVLIGLILFLFTLIITKYVSAASIVAAISLPLSYFILYKKNLNIYFLSLTIFIAFYIIFKHRENIKRIIKKEEYKWGTKIN